MCRRKEHGGLKPWTLSAAIMSGGITDCQPRTVAPKVVPSEKTMVSTPASDMEVRSHLSGNGARGDRLVRTSERQQQRVGRRGGSGRETRSLCKQNTAFEHPHTTEGAEGKQGRQTTWLDHRRADSG